MTVTENMERIAVVINWDTNVVHGETAECQVNNPAEGDEFHTVKHFLNDGEGWLSFPAGYTGECNVKMIGSDSGEDASDGPLQIGSVQEPGTEEE